MAWFIFLIRGLNKIL